MESPKKRPSADRVGAREVAVASVQELDGMIVNAEISDFGEDGEEQMGRVIEVSGYRDDFGVDVEIIIRKHHIPHEFPTDVSAQAAAFGSTIAEEEIAQRRDFRDLDIVTIDGETARDFDDAVWAERSPNGHF
ncbi:hypothetical protein OY671_011974, partial [Metschnikowia pulcherrima]